MKRNVILVCLAVVVAGLVIALALRSGGGAPDNVDAFQLAQRIASGSAPRILDVRTPQEYAAGHVPGAINIPHDQLAARLGEVTAGKGEELVVFCQKGGRAKQAQKTLMDAGYTQVRHLEGDMQRWREGSYPTQ